MLNCHDATRLISEARERELTMGEKLSLKMHVMMCAGCRNFDKQMDFLRQIARSYTGGLDEATGPPEQVDQDDQNDNDDRAS